MSLTSLCYVKKDITIANTFFTGLNINWCRYCYNQSDKIFSPGVQQNMRYAAEFSFLGEPSLVKTKSVLICIECFGISFKS